MRVWVSPRIPRSGTGPHELDELHELMEWVFGGMNCSSRSPLQETPAGENHNCEYPPPTPSEGGLILLWFKNF